MTKVPTIKGSAQARLLLYRLFSLGLTDAEQRLLNNEHLHWDQILAAVEATIEADSQIKSGRAVHR